MRDDLVEQNKRRKTGQKLKIEPSLNNFSECQNKKMEFTPTSE